MVHLRYRSKFYKNILPSKIKMLTSQAFRRKYMDLNTLKRPKKHVDLKLSFR